MVEKHSKITVQEKNGKNFLNKKNLEREDTPVPRFGYLFFFLSTCTQILLGQVDERDLLSSSFDSFWLGITVKRKFHG